MALGRSWGYVSVGVARRSFFINFLSNIMNTWPNQCSWDLSIRSRSDSTFKALRVSQLRSLSWSVTALIVWKNPIYGAFNSNSIPSVITQNSWPQVRIGTKNATPRYTWYSALLLTCSVHRIWFPQRLWYLCVFSADFIPEGRTKLINFMMKVFRICKQYQIARKKRTVLSTASKSKKTRLTFKILSNILRSWVIYSN